MPKVAQFKRVWLGGTETAIDNHVRSLRRHAALAFADQQTDRFPWSYPTYCPPDELQDGLARRLTWYRRLSGPMLDWYSMEMICRDIGLMHMHFGTDALYYQPVAIAADLPFLVTFHGHDAYRFPNLYCGLAGKYLRTLFQRATRILTVSNHMRMHLISLGCPSEKVKTVRVGIDLNQFTFQPPKPGPTTRITCVAGFRPKKGLSDLIEAFRRATIERPGLELVLVGDGPLRPAIEQQIANCHLRSEVILTGHIPLPEVAQILSDTQIYIQPSVTAPDGDREGIPATVMEAMARGLPVISTRHSGIPELVQERVTGFLVDEHDLDALAESMLLLADSPQLWGPMGEAARERVARLHDIERQTAVIEQIYDELMGGLDSAAVHPIGQFQQIPETKVA